MSSRSQKQIQNQKSVSKSPKASPKKMSMTQSTDKKTKKSPSVQKANSPQKSQKSLKSSTSKKIVEESKSNVQRVKKTKAQKDQVMQDCEYSLSQILVPVPPKKTMSSYLLFTNDRRQAIQKANPELKMTEIAKIIGQEWKNLSDSQKKFYEQMSVEDKKRYENEKLHFETKGFFINAKGENSNDLMLQNPKFQSHVVQPKLPSSSFMMFNRTLNATIREQNPDLKLTQITKQIGEKWNQLNDQQKLPFMKMSEEDTQRYQREVQQLIKNGFFINSQGVKSTDLKVKKKRKFSELPAEPKTAPTFGSQESGSSVKRRKLSQDAKTDKKPKSVSQKKAKKN